MALLPEVNIKVIKTYSTNLICVDRVLTLDDQTALISNILIPALNRIHINDIDMVDIQTLNGASVQDMARTQSGDILLTIRNNNSTDVYMLAHTGLQLFLSVAPMFPHGIHVTQHNEIVLGVTEQNDDMNAILNLTEASRRKVLIFGMDRIQRQTYEFDKHNQRLFTVPVRVTSNINNDLLVIDMFSKTQGRVVVLNREGHVKWTYHGNPQVNVEERSLNPMDIVTTSAGHVIVADLTTHALHVLSSEGDQLACRVMVDQGIRFPMSLDIDTRGQLWIGSGCDNGIIQYDRRNAKLHIVKLPL